MVHAQDSVIAVKSPRCAYTTQKFYGDVFGWQFQEYGPPGFLQILDESGTTPMGAIQQRRQLRTVSR